MPLRQIGKTWYIDDLNGGVKMKLKRLLPLLFLLILLSNTALAEYWGSKKSDKFHYPSCNWAQKIKPENKIIFTTREEALKAGYVPCKVCQP